MHDAAWSVTRIELACGYISLLFVMLALTFATSKSSQISFKFSSFINNHELGRTLSILKSFLNFMLYMCHYIYHIDFNPVQINNLNNDLLSCTNCENTIEARISLRQGKMIHIHKCTFIRMYWTKMPKYIQTINSTRLSLLQRLIQFSDLNSWTLSKRN